MSEELNMRSLRKWISDVNIPHSDFEKWLQVKLPDFEELDEGGDFYEVVDDQSLSILNFMHNHSDMLIVRLIKRRHVLGSELYQNVCRYFWDELMIDIRLWIQENSETLTFIENEYFDCESDQLEDFIKEDCVLGVHRIVQKYGNVNICFADNGRKTILEKLIEYYKYNSIECNNHYLLYYLLSYDELYVDGFCENSGTILHYLCSLKDADEIIQYVLDMYAHPSNPKLDVYKKDEEGRSALMIATEANHIDNVKVILDYHKKSPSNLILLQDENKEKQSPLFRAIRNEHYRNVHYEIADLLLGAGFDINKEDIHGDTILSHVKRHNLRGLHYLQEKGARWHE